MAGCKSWGHGGLAERPSAVPLNHETIVIEVGWWTCGLCCHRQLEPCVAKHVDTCARGCSPIVTSPMVDRHQAPVPGTGSSLADGSDGGCWNREVVSTVRGEECHLRLLLVMGDTMKSSTYVGQ
ncbi:hypothetical protein M514_09009 [Trichuris suis]|uniref:Uncharacterized protein n=1 Tax=Trichuris suis TaxID=68888 RepID=A0A085LYK3_9BILA|nr:hypothetical protein M513_09009 [Trichuris suis]KFD62519.1 hypothetical protein M514_09009 [Trichuris suis]